MPGIDGVTGNGIPFHERYYTPDGCVFQLLCTRDITDEQIKVAKSWLRNERDVVGIEIIRIDPAVQRA